jgi:hypothetical protein
LFQIELQKPLQNSNFVLSQLYPVGSTDAVGRTGTTSVVPTGAVTAASVSEI